MATPEASVKEPIRKYLKKQEHCWTFWPVQMGMGASGIPDCLGVYKGRPFAVEVKAPGKTGNLSPGQEQQIGLLQKAGAEVFVTDNSAEFIAQFECWCGPIWVAS